MEIPSVHDFYPILLCSMVESTFDSKAGQADFLVLSIFEFFVLGLTVGPSA